MSNISYLRNDLLEKISDTYVTNEYLREEFLNELNQEIEPLIQKLDSYNQDIVYKIFWKQFSVKELAYYLDKPEVQIHQEINQALNQLKKYYWEQELCN